MAKKIKKPSLLVDNPTESIAKVEQSEQKVLTIKSFNGIGDLLFATPSLKVIKKAYGDKIKIKVNTNYPELLSGNPNVDEIGNNQTEGTFLDYADPIHKKRPDRHHIIEDWVTICYENNLEGIDIPELKPEIYLSDRITKKKNVIGVQILHKGHWHGKKIWDKFDRLSKLPGFEPIPFVQGDKLQLAYSLESYKGIVCAEGGISHLARALDIPAVVIFGGFALPEWSGYKEQINIINEKHCSWTCYSPDACINSLEKICMKEITLDQILIACENITGSEKFKSKINLKASIIPDASKWCKGKGIDIINDSPIFPSARPVTVSETYKISSLAESFDYVFSCCYLEHLEDPYIALKEWTRVLKQFGILYLYLPSSNYIPWRTESMPKFHKHTFYHDDLVDYLQDKYEILEVVRSDEFFCQKIIAKKK